MDQIPMAVRLEKLEAEFRALRRVYGDRLDMHSVGLRDANENLAESQGFYDTRMNAIERRIAAYEVSSERALREMTESRDYWRSKYHRLLEQAPLDWSPP